MKDVLAMILAGGRGTRMELLCQWRAKPVVPFAGVFRVIDFTLSNCVNSGINQVNILIDHAKESIKEYVDSGTGWGLPSPGSLNLLEPGLGSYRGTADAVFQNLALVEQSGPREVLILAADHIYHMDYRPLVAFHRRAGAEVTIAATRVRRGEANRFGILTTDATGRLVRFEEKPERPTGNLASMGIYVFDKSSLIRWLTADAQYHLSSHDFGRAIIPRIVREGKAAVYEFRGSWEDIGTVPSYYGANMEALCRPQRLFKDSWPILTRQTELPPPKLSPSARVIDCIVGGGCQIEGQVINSVLSPGVRVGVGAVVRDSILMANTVVGRYSRVEQAIVDEGASIGEFCYIGLPVGKPEGPSRLTVIGGGAAISAHTAVAWGNSVPGGGASPPSSRTVVGLPELVSVA